MKNLILITALLSASSSFAMTFKKCDVQVTIEKQKKSFFSKKWKTIETLKRDPCWIGFMDLFLRDVVDQPSSASCGTNLDGFEYSVDISTRMLQENLYEYKLMVGNNDFGTDLTPHAIVVDQKILSGDDNYSISKEINYIAHEEDRRRSVLTNVAVNCVND